MVTEIWSTLAGKYGLDTFGQAKFNDTSGELQRVATMPESSSVAVNFQQLDGGETMTPGGYGWLEMKEGVVGNKIQLVVSPKTGENPGGAKRNNRRFSSFGHRRSGYFSTTWTVEVWWPVFKLQIGTELDRNGGRKWKLRLGHVCGSGRVFGSVVGSFSHSHMWLPSPVFELILLFILTFNRLFLFI